MCITIGNINVPCQHLKGGCFTGSIYTKKTKAFSSAHAHTYPVYGWSLAFVFSLIVDLCLKLNQEKIYPIWRTVNMLEVLRQGKCIVVDTFVNSSIFRTSSLLPPNITRWRSLATSTSSSSKGGRFLSLRTSIPLLIM